MIMEDLYGTVAEKLLKLPCYLDVFGCYSCIVYGASYYLSKLKCCLVRSLHYKKYIRTISEALLLLITFKRCS